MSSFRSTCAWFGGHRFIAFLVGLPTLGFAWAMAGIGRSRDSGGYNLVANWSESSHGRRLFTAAIINVIVTFAVAFSAFGMLGHGNAFALIAIIGDFVVMIAAFDVAGALRSGRDAFELYTSFDQEPPMPVSGRVPRVLQDMVAGLPPRPRRAVALLWCWAVACAMIGAVVTMIALFVVIWLLSFVVTVAVSAATGEKGSSEPRERRTIRYAVPQTPDGGLFVEAIATIEGNEIRERDGGPFARVLATIRGNGIMVGEGVSAEIAFTIEGKHIKAGTGGPFAETVATIEGNRIMSGEGGPFAETLYTIHER